MHCIPQISSITVVSPSDCLVSYPGHSLRESNHSAVVQSVYSAALADKDCTHKVEKYCGGEVVKSSNNFPIDLYSDFWSIGNNNLLVVKSHQK